MASGTSTTNTGSRKEAKQRHLKAACKHLVSAMPPEALPEVVTAIVQTLQYHGVIEPKKED